MIIVLQHRDRSGNSQEIRRKYAIHYSRTVGKSLLSDASNRLDLFQFYSYTGWGSINMEQKAMSKELSRNARQILEAGKSAAQLASDDDQRIKLSDRAVLEAVGQLCGRPDSYGEVTAIDALVEIAQEHVRAIAMSGKS